MGWPEVALIAYAFGAAGALAWIDRRFKPPGWVSWLLLAVVTMPAAHVLMMRLGLAPREALWTMPFIALATAFRMGLDWLFEKVRTRNDD